MDLIDRLRELSLRIDKLREQLVTEEATKNALIMPFISALGYDVFNPLEVLPEFTADVGTKKGEKVDYAIMREGKPIMLIECKCAGADLDKDVPSQLYRYFSVTEARFGVLTDGIVYKFFSDLEEPNKMDSRPFLEFSLPQINESVAQELKKFARETFDLDNILSTASDLKYTRGIKRVLAEELVNPSEEFVRILASRVYSGRITQTVKEQFTQITSKAFNEFVSDQVNKRLQTALEREATRTAPPQEPGSVSAESPEGADADIGIVTTEEEIEGYHIVKSIVREVVEARRIAMRDAKGCCNVLLDDTNRKPICRMFFSSPQKFFGTINDDKSCERHPISDLDEIYKYSDVLKRTVLMYEGKIPGGNLNNQSSDL